MTAKVLLLIGLCFCLIGNIIAFVNAIWTLYQMEKRHKKENEE